MVGDLARVKYFLSDDRTNVNSKGKNDMTSMMYPEKEGHREVFDELAREGANLSLVDDGDRHILHLACIRGNVEIVKRKAVFDLLVEAKADLSLVNVHAETILHVACEGGNVEIIKFILKHDTVDIGTLDINGRTSAIITASEGCKNTLDVLMEAGADLSVVYNERNTVLHLACGGGNVEIVKDLLSHIIVDIDSRDADGWTLLLHAVRAVEKDVFNLRVEKGAHLSLVYNESETLLHVACKVGTVAIMKCLLAHDIMDTDSRDSAGWTPEMRAPSVGHKHVVDVFVEAEADLSMVNNNNETILHVGCKVRHVAIIKYLVTRDIMDIDRRDRECLTPVMGAAIAGHEDVFDVFVEAGANLLPVNDAKETILHLSCEGENVKIIKYLLTHNIADIDSQGENGYTSVMYTALYNSKYAFDVLVTWGADLSLLDDDDYSILH
ncbi:putative ankyrin repeat protein RF_0381 [Haliotis asinina]|uniref:putative ankyrin repeat protein RF_0381 n=1 Tax=Haliotis asinina TaxID=109174 RepID=UPI003531B1C5